MNIEKIKKLAKLAYEQKEKFMHLGRMNANQPDPKKRKAQAIMYEVARAEMFEAYVDLLEEQRARPVNKRKADKPLSQCVTKELIEFISKTVPIGKEQEWYVMVNEHCHTIDFIDPITMEIHSIEASKICYKAEGNND